MDKSQSEERVVITDDKDALVLRGSNDPILFIAATHVASLASPERVPALFITDVGAAAIRSVIAADATIKSSVKLTPDGAIAAATLLCMLPNGLVVAYTTDEALAADRHTIKSLGIDLLVTDSSVDWPRRHTALVSAIVGNTAAVPPQVTSLRDFDWHEIARVVLEAATRQESTEEKPS
jgi:hypothetical protein